MENTLNIIGGGITGLAAAYIAAKAGQKTRVLEASPQVGGLLRTFEAGGEPLEFFYHHFFTHDKELRFLLEELGIGHLLEFRPGSMGVFSGGQIYPFDSPADLFSFSPIAWPDKIKFGLSSLYLSYIARWENCEGISAAEWLQRYAGKTSWLSLWKPMLDIKFGPYSQDVPLSWLAGRLRQRVRSREKGGEKLGYLKGSLQTLLIALQKRLPEMGVEIITEAPMIGMETEDGKIRGIITPKGVFEGNLCLITAPGKPLAPIIQAHCPPLARQLDSLEYFGAVCAVLELSEKLGDIYWLNVADPGFPFGGLIEHTRLLPPERYGGSHIVYLSRYFAKNEPIAGMGEEEVLRLMLPCIPKIYPSFSEKTIKKASVFKSMSAAPVCGLHFSQQIPSCKTELEGLYIANMAHIYPDERSANNSIRVAAEACRAMGLAVGFVPAGNSMAGKIGFGGR